MVILSKKALIMIMVCMSFCVKANNIEFLDKKIIKNLTASVYEIVVPKIESTKIKYARKLPFEKLSYKERNEKFHSIGTAFFINKKELMSAAHVFKLEEFSLYHQNMFIRDTKGEIFKISRVNKYSSLRDMIIFELESYPKKVYPLHFSNEIEIGDTVFSVGNVQGEGISFRAGQIASFTTEAEYGMWKDIRFTAPASPGNSGGPLVKVNGEVVGLIVKKNSSENHNIAIPVAEIEKLTHHADFFLRNVTMNLSKEQNNILKDWKQSFELPSSVIKLSKLAQNSLNDFYTMMERDLHHKFKDTYFPLGKRFRAYLRDQQYIRQFGVLNSDADFKEWSLNSYSVRSIPLQKNQKINVSQSDLAALHIIIEKPASMSLSKFLNDPSIIMDNILKGIPITRNMGADKIRIISLGKAEKIDKWEDDLGRKWVSTLWFLPYIDAFTYSHCLAYPKGAICNVDFKKNSELYMGYLPLIKQNYNEIAIGYEAKVIDWLEYFSLDKSLLPKSFKNSEMKMDNDQFEFNFDNFKLSLANNKINNQSNIHFHFGYSNKHLIDEDLLLFELFPNKAVKSHFRIEKNLSPSEFSTDKYKNKWNEIENLRGDYSGKLIKKEGTFMIKKVIAQTKKEIATELNQIYVVGCIHNTMKENIESNCNHFSKGVTFY
jgi:serine protease Do